MKAKQLEEKPRMCDCCGNYPAIRNALLAMRLQESDEFDYIGAAQEDILLCVKGGCFKKFKESYWRMHKKYTKSRRQEVSE